MTIKKELQFVCFSEGFSVRSIVCKDFLFQVLDECFHLQENVKDTVH